MDCARNIITANFSGGKTHATTARVSQWSRGIELCITGADNLPQTFKAHFSVQKRGGVATTIVGIDERVDIPNVLFTIGKDIHVWLGASETEDDAEILYTVDIPVAPAPMPEYYDAEDTGVFDEVVEQVADYAATATAAANSAGASATAAAGSASAAAASASSAAGSAVAAEQARDDAVTAKGQAETAAQTATEKAQQTAQNASQAALDAGRAESAAERAESAETGAGAAKTAAEAAAQSAAASAATADEKATLAGQSATAAAGSASAAAQSAASIEGDVQIASQKASEAQTAAGQAVSAKDAAVTARQGAETAATNAGQSASTATAKAAEAAQSASNAAQSKTDAEAAAARAEQAAATLTVDTALSDTSTNPVQNKVITGEITDVKTALEAVTKGTAQIGMGFVQGVRYDGAPSTVTTSSTRCTAQRAISVGAKDVIEITIPSGLKAGVVTTLGTSSGWKTSTYTFTATAACDVYLNVAKTSDEGVTPSEITGIVINYTDNSSRVSILEEDDEWLTDAVNHLGAISPIESPGYINGSGGISAQSSTRVEVYTNKIPVSIGDKVTIKLRYTASHELWVVYALYKADESYITRVTLVNGTSANYYEETITITNANAQYIAFSYRTYGDVMATIIKENTTAEKLGSPFATIVPADSYTYPTIDTTAKTLTIQNGTIIIDRRLPSGKLALSNQICDYSSVSSTAILFTWDIANSAIVAFAYNAVIDLTNYIPLCSLRTSKGLVGSTIPIMVDGQLYGKVNLDHINQGSLWKNDNVRGVNHRGYATVAPENTLPAFKLSKDMGFSYVETDIRFTSDGVPVLLHDATINRTARNSDGTEISDTINIADITYEEASAYDYGIWKGSAYAGTPIPTFAQFLKACRRLGLRPYIELKAGTQVQVDGLVDTAISCGFKGLCTWISFSETYLSYVKNHASGERLGLIADTYSSALITTIDGLKTPDNEVFLDMTVLGQISDTVVENLISADIALECFINGNYSIIAANPYITGITTDSGNIGQYMYTLWSHNIYA